MKKIGSFVIDILKVIGIIIITIFNGLAFVFLKPIEKITGQRSKILQNLKSFWGDCFDPSLGPW